MARKAYGIASLTAQRVAGATQCLSETTLIFKPSRMAIAMHVGEKVAKLSPTATQRLKSLPILNFIKIINKFA